MWTLQLIFAGLLKEALTFGIGALIIAGLIAGAFLLPFVWAKKVCLSLAALVAAAFIAYGTGVQHERYRQSAKEVVIERRNDAARSDAEQSVPPVIPGRVVRPGSKRVCNHPTGDKNDRCR